jgi:hypothetical protein
MIRLSQHLKGRWELHDAMQASRCAFERAQTRTFQNVGTRIEFICALAALSPAQQPHIKEALDLATQLQVGNPYVIEESDSISFDRQQMIHPAWVWNTLGVSERNFALSALLQVRGLHTLS